MDGIELEEVCAWASEAGVLGRQYFNNVRSRRKPDHSLVTEADEAIEHLLVQRIASRYPEHGIIGEEQTRRGLDREFLWAIDPIDGTASFVSGLPTWCISIGLLHKGQPFAGVLHVPLLDDYYWAIVGNSAFLNGEPIHVSDASTWDSEDWLGVPSNVHLRYAITFPGKVRSIGSTAVAMAYVARGGNAVAALMGRPSIWDIAASLIIVQAAGGSVETLEGAPLDISAMLDGRRSDAPLIAATPARLAALRRFIHWREPPLAPQ